MKFESRKIDFVKEPSFFLHLTDEWDVERYPALWAIGDPNLLTPGLTGIFCSRKCPGKVIVRSREFIDDLRRRGVPVIGGFQTPVEKMCLEVLLLGSQPVVVCPARGIQKMRVPAEWSPAVSEGRLLIVSPFPARYKRVTTPTAESRNRFVAAASKETVFLHAANNSRTLSFAGELLAQGKDVFTLDVKENDQLRNLGASTLRDR